MLIVLCLVSHFNFLFVPCGRLSWLPVSFLLHVKYTLYHIVLYREGTLKVGDRVLAANGISLMQRTLGQALNFLRDVPDDEVAFLVEYDVSVLGQYANLVANV